MHRHRGQVDLGWKRVPALTSSHPAKVTTSQASASSSESKNVNRTNLVSVIRRTPWDNAPGRYLTCSLALRMDASHHYLWVFYFCSWSYSSSWQSVRWVTSEPGLFHIFLHSLPPPAQFPGPQHNAIFYHIIPVIFSCMLSAYYRKRHKRGERKGVGGWGWDIWGASKGRQTAGEQGNTPGFWVLISWQVGQGLEEVGNSMLFTARMRGCPRPGSLTLPLLLAELVQVKMVLPFTLQKPWAKGRGALQNRLDNYNFQERLWATLPSARTPLPPVPFSPTLKYSWERQLGALTVAVASSSHGLLFDEPAGL